MKNIIMIAVTMAIVAGVVATGHAVTIRTNLGTIQQQLASGPLQGASQPIAARLHPGGIQADPATPEEVAAQQNTCRQILEILEQTSQAVLTLTPSNPVLSGTESAYNAWIAKPVPGENGAAAEDYLVIAGKVTNFDKSRHTMNIVTVAAGGAISGGGAVLVTYKKWPCERITLSSNNFSCIFKKSEMTGAYAVNADGSESIRFTSIITSQSAATPTLRVPVITTSPQITVQSLDDNQDSDPDFDAIPVDWDNCPDKANFDQLDADEDGEGAVCDENDTPPAPATDPCENIDETESALDEASAEALVREAVTSPASTPKNTDATLISVTPAPPPDPAARIGGLIGADEGCSLVGLDGASPIVLLLLAVALLPRAILRRKE